MARLGDICSFQSGGTPSKKEPTYFNGDIPWITTIALNGKVIDAKDAVDWITEKAIRESAAKIVPTRSIMIGTRVGVGKVAMNAIPMSTSQDIISLIGIDENRWSKPYLCKFILGKNAILISQARGATIKGIKMDVLAELDVPNIPLSDQCKIAFVLDKVDELIALRKQQLAKLDELVKARFVEMFGPYIRSSSKLALKDVSEFVSVGIANSATHAYADTGIVMLRNQNIKENYLDDSDLIYIKPEFAALYQSKKLRENDILVIRTGYPGVACLVPAKYEGCQTFTTLIVRLKQSVDFLPLYICHYINSRYGKTFVDEMKVGVAQQNFGAKSLEKMPIAIPPIEAQERFAAFIGRTDKSKDILQKSIGELKTLKKALMQKYFGGGL